MNRISRHYYTGFIFSLLFLITLAYSLYRRGLFFAPEQLAVSATVLIAFVVGVLVLVASKEFRPTIWLLPICTYCGYTLLSTLWSVSLTAAVSGSVVVAAAVAIAILAQTLTDEWRLTLLSIISLSGGAVFLFALLASANVVNYQDAILGNMMASVFQYHNTFGAYELTTAVLAVSLSLHVNRGWEKGIYSLNTSLCLTGVVASYSRWVWLLTIVMLILFLLGSIVVRQGFQALVAIVITLVTTGVSVLFTLRAMHQPSLKYLLLSVGVALVGGAIHTIVVRFLQFQKMTKVYKWLTILVPVVIACVSVGVLMIHPPAAITSILGRAHTIQLSDFSLQERLWYYGAAIHMWLDHPMFGTGLGTWSAKFQMYQQFPYWTTRTHSVLMDQLVDLGVFGTLLWLATIVSGIYLAVREIAYNKSAVALSALLGAMTLLIHAVFDFDMDYPVVLFVFFVLLVLGGRSRVVKDTSVPHRARALIYLPMLGGAAIMSVFGIMLALSEVTQQKAGQVSQPNDRISLLQKSLQYASYNGDAQFQLANAEWERLVQSKSKDDEVVAWSDIQRAQRLEPWNPQVQEFSAVSAYQSGHVNEALTWAHQAFVDGRFTDSYPEVYMGIALWTGVGEYRTNPVDAVNQWRNVVHTYEAVQQNVKSIEDLPKDIHAERSYNISAQMQAYVATAEYCLKEYKQSMKDINSMSDPGINVNASGLRDIVKALDQMRLGTISNQQIAQVYIHATPTGQQQYQVLSNINNH